MRDVAIVVGHAGVRKQRYPAGAFARRKSEHLRIAQVLSAVKLEPLHSLLLRDEPVRGFCKRDVAASRDYFKFAARARIKANENTSNLFLHIRAL